MGLGGEISFFLIKKPLNPIKRAPFSLPKLTLNLQSPLLQIPSHWGVRISVQFSRSVMSDSLWLRESQHARPPCPLPLPEFTQTHVHWVDDSIQPSHQGLRHTQFGRNTKSSIRNRIYTFSQWDLREVTLELLNYLSPRNMSLCFKVQDTVEWILNYNMEDVNIFTDDYGRFMCICIYSVIVPSLDLSS